MTAITYRQCHHLTYTESALAPSGFVELRNVNPRIKTAPANLQLAVCALCLGQLTSFVLSEIQNIPAPRGSKEKKP